MCLDSLDKGTVKSIHSATKLTSFELIFFLLKILSFYHLLYLVYNFQANLLSQLYPCKVLIWILLRFLHTTQKATLYYMSTESRQLIHTVIYTVVKYTM